MNKDQLYISTNINYLKGLIHNIDVHKKYFLIEDFLKIHQKNLEHFEKSEVLSFAIKHTKHSKLITKIFLHNGYDSNKDPAIINAIKLQKFKSVKAILKSGFNINSDFHNKKILALTLSLIDETKSNTTLRKINSILDSLNIFELNFNIIQESQIAIEEAEEKINSMYEAHPQLTQDIQQKFSQFKQKIDLISKKHLLEQNLVEKSIQIPKAIQKI